MMRLGISSASFFPRVYTEASFRHMKSLGLQTAEVFFNSLCEYGGGRFFPAIRDNACGEGVAVHSVHALSNQFEPELFSRNPRARADAYDILARVLAGASELGAAAYTFHGPPKLKKVPYHHDFGHLAAAMNAVTAEAARYGVRVAYENVHWCFCDTPDYFAQLAARCPDLGATLDIKQALLGGVPYAEFIDAMGARLTTVHLCDIGRDGLPCLPGRGTVDFADLFARLQRAGYRGPLILEVYTKNYETETELADCIGRLQSLLP